MSIFGKIAHAIFGSHMSPEPMSRHEVEAMIAKKAVTNDEQTRWRTSVVDLLKLLGVPSDLDSRKELADELGYKGRLDGSEAMNTWLHAAVMKKLCETGGTVPDSFKD